MHGPKELIVSAITRARTELEDALYELEKLPAVSDSSVSFTAHALNNFLTITGGIVELLQSSLADYPDQDVHTGLATLQQATILMTQTVTKLTSASVNTDTKPRFEQVDLAVMVQRFSTFYQRIANRKQIRILSPSVGDVPPAWTDRMMIAVVLDNLVSNAVKYSPPGKHIRIQVSVEQDMVVCSVCDEGPGLTQEDQAKLFQRRTILTSKPTGGETSTGYGLAVAKEFVERLRGTIRCESVFGQGACFIFRLPRYQEDVK